MPPKLHVPNHFKFKYFFGGWVQGKALAPDESIYFDVHESNHMGEQINQLQNLELITIML